MAIRYTYAIGVLFCMAWISCAFAQTGLEQEWEENRKAFEGANTDKKRVTALNEAAWDMGKVLPDTALYCARRAEALAMAANDSAGWSTSFIRQSRIWRHLGNTDSALYTAQASYEMETARGYTFGAARAVNQLAILEEEAGELATALQRYQEAYRLFGEIGNVNGQVAAGLNVGRIHRQLGEWEAGQAQYLAVLAVLEEHGGVRDRAGRMAKVNAELGLLYKNLKDYALALKYQHRALQMYRQLPHRRSEWANVMVYIANVYLDSGQEYDSAYYYLQKARAIKVEILSAQGLAEVYNSLANYYQDMGHQDSASYYLAFAKEGSQLSTQASVFNNEGDLAFSKGDYIKALRLFDASYRLELDRNIISYDQYLALTNKAKTQKMLQAYDSAWLTLAKKDSIRSILEQEYRITIQQAKQFELQRKEIELQRKEIENQRLARSLNIGLVLLFFTLSIVVWQRWRVRKVQAERERAELAKALLDQRYKALVNDQQLKTYEAMVAGADQERKRVAQDLHDQLGSILSMVKMNFTTLDTALTQLQEDNRRHYGQAMELLDNALSQVRRIAYELGTEKLEQFGLGAALEDLVATVNDTGQLSVTLIPTHFAHRLPKAVELGVFKAVGELLTNVLKHARAQEASVQLIYTQNTLRVTVEDDGVGFDYHQVQAKESMGLRGIQSRMTQLGGEVAFDSTPGQGTVVTLEIPVEEIS